MTETFEIKFSEKDVLFKNLLASPDQLDYGDISLKDCKAEIQIGKKPIVRNLRKLYELKGSELPADLKVFDVYDIWLVTYSVGIVSEGGLKKIRQVQFDTEYVDEATDQPDVTIIDMLPQTKFNTVLLGKLGLNASINLNGNMELSEHLSAIISNEQIGVGASISVTDDMNAVCNLNLKLITSEITSIGIGNYAASWVLERTTNNVLLGDQLLVQTILVQKDMPYIDCKLRASAVCSAPFGLLPLRLRSEWHQIRIQLA